MAFCSLAGERQFRSVLWTTHKGKVVGGPRLALDWVRSTQVVSRSPENDPKAIRGAGSSVGLEEGKEGFHPLRWLLVEIRGLLVSRGACPLQTDCRTPEQLVDRQRNGCTLLHRL